MRKRFYRVVGVMACGCAFQLLGCQSRQIAEILADSAKGTAVEVSTVVVEAFVDQVLGLP
ncbi:MAG: hypothetical protein ACE5EX_07660 [Phycisphaerae bacterium]